MNNLIGQKAPYFKTSAVVDGSIDTNFSLSSFEGRRTILFFYPLDFTFVCPTELHAFQEKLEEFEKRGAQLIGCSVDSVYSHLAWMNTSKSKGGIEGVSYPLMSDLNKRVARDYGVLNEEEGVAFRGLFLIDKKQIVRHMLINDLPLGRSVNEALRMLDALIFYEEHGEVCPADWNVGDRAMAPNETGLKEYFKSQ